MRTNAFIAVFGVLLLIFKQSAAHRAAIVANGLECAAIARFVFVQPANDIW